MGIPYYFYVITQKYKGILHSTKPFVDFYFFDFNGIIHPVCQNVLRKVSDNENSTSFHKEAFEESVCTESWKYTLDLMKRLEPACGGGIFIDGVAPVAKINQQRKRRYLSILRHKMEGKNVIWDTNAISPGTSFMKKMATILKETTSHHECSFTFSSADEEGEGEHKIFQHIEDHKLHDKKIAIHGLDADLIMLSLLSHHRKIYLVRENKTSTIEEPSISYLDIAALRTGILQELRCSPDLIDNSFSAASCDLIESYVVACFMLGNDFLPHLATVNLKKQGMDRLIGTLCEIQAAYDTTLVSGGSINVELLHKIIEKLAKTEDVDIAKVNEDYVKQKAFLQTPMDAIEFYPIVPKNKARLAHMLYANGNAGAARWRSMYYKELFGTKVFESHVVLSACRKFVEGIVWTYRYYKRMKKDPMWYYPYNYGPTLLDLSNFLFTEQAWVVTVHKEWESAQYSRLFVSSDIQLLSIMPVQSADILPVHIQNVMKDLLFGCSHMYPIEYPIQTYLKTHLWECSPILPPIDFERIRKAVARATKT
jgi:5'-3' exonuclease